MADVTVNVLEPATNFDLITLEELKVALGLPTAADPATDPQLQWLIEVNSAVIAELTNRVFAKEKVRETWRCLGSRRVYLSHYPVKPDDIESVTTNGNERIDYELEEATGKLSIFTARQEPIVIVYTGGFDLPDEAPDALKQAVALMVTTTKGEQQAASLTGVRMIAHKESRVMFHSPTSSGGSSGGASTSSGLRDTVKALLGHYVRHWV